MYHYHWQYNGCTYWNEIIHWCYDHIYGKYYHNGAETIWFRDEAAYTAFLLKWS